MYKTKVVSMIFVFAFLSFLVESDTEYNSYEVDFRKAFHEIR